MRWLTGSRADDPKPDKPRKSGRTRKTGSRRGEARSPRNRIGALQIAASAGIFLAAAALSGGATYALRHDLHVVAADWTRTGIARLGAGVGLNVQNVWVHGRDRSTRASLHDAIGVDRGTPILAVDLAEVRTRVESMPWVKTARIERHLPDTLRLWLTERQPLALWQHDGSVRLVDTDGTVIDAPIGGFAHLPLIVGAAAPRHAAVMLEALAQRPDLGKRVRALQFVAERRWSLTLDRLPDGMRVHLPATDDPGAALDRLARLNAHHGILDRSLSSIDLRLADRIVLRPDDVLEIPASDEAKTTPPAVPGRAREI